MVNSKKLLLMSLCLALILSVLAAGCSQPTQPTPAQPTPSVNETPSGNEETGKTALEHKTITLALEDDGSIDWTNPDLFTMDLLEEAGNLTINVLPIAQNDREAKLQTLIASKNLPDLTYNEDENWYREYATRLFVPLDDKWDKLPTFTEYIKKYPEYYKNFKASDGKIYGIPQVMDSMGYYSYMWMVRADILRDNGMELESIVTLDDFHKALQTFKNVKGKAPWVARTDGKSDVFIGRTATAFGTSNKVYWNAVANQYNLGPAEDNFKLMVETLAQFYNEGLIHPEIFSMKDQVWEQLILNDEAYFFIDNWKARWTPLDSDREDFVVMLPPKVNGQRYYGAQDRPHASPDVKYWVISKDTKALDNILAAMDWAFSDEAITKFNYGIEGQSYKMIDGKPMFVWEGGPTQENYYDTQVGPLGLRSGRNGFVVTTEIYLTQFIPGNEFILDRAKFYEDNGVVAPAAPVLSFTEDELDRVKQIESSLNTHMQEQVARFVTGLRNLSEYDKFIEEMKSMKSDELLKIYNDALGRLQ